MTSTEIIQCSGGSVRGIRTLSGYRFLGIPYARADRFRAPVKAVWSGVLDAYEYAAYSAQPNYHGKWPENSAFRMLGGEDCQNLNIWTPTLEKKNLPVLVYIHGGAFQSGSGNDPECSGEEFCDSADVVYVTINERVGILGYLELGGILGEEYRGSGNNGAKDIIEALKWIRQNIHLFGGDSRKVTLMGTSAGAKMIASLTTSPESGKLFSRVILESGATQSLRSMETAEAVANAFLNETGLKAEELLTISTVKLMEAQAAFCDSAGATCYFGPVFDEKLFFTDWKNNWAKGENWKGEALLGSCLNELYRTARSREFQSGEDEVLRKLFGAQKDHAWEAFRLLEEKKNEEDESVRWTQVLSDFMYRYYTEKYADLLTEYGNAVWLYSFELQPAIHGMGQAVSLGKYEAALPETSRYELNTLSRHIRMRFMQFAAQGDPNRAELTYWPAYAEGKKFVFDVPCRVDELKNHKPLSCFPEYVYSKS